MTNRYVPIGLAITALTFFVALRPSDVLTDVGVTMHDVRAGTLQNLRHEGEFSFSPHSAIRQAAARIPAGSRAATVRMLGHVVRSYVESDAFQHDYQQSPGNQPPGAHREATVSSREAQPGSSAETINAQMAAIQQAYLHLDPTTLYSAITKQLPQMEAELATLQGDDQRLMQQHITETNRMLSACVDKPAEFKKQYLAYQLQQLKQSAQPPVTNAATELTKAKPHNARNRNQHPTPSAPFGRCYESG